MAEKEMEMGLESFSLETPKAVKTIDANELEKVSGVESETGQIKTITKLEQATITNLDGQVDAIMNDLMKTPSNSKEMKDLTSALNRMGDAEISKTSSVSNRMLSRPVRGLRSTGAGGDSVVESLKNLRKKVGELDPSQRDKLFSKNKFLGIKLPWGDKIDSYFQEYKSSEDQISSIIKSLSNGKDELLQDNATIDEEREQMQDLMVRLEQYAYIMRRLDKKIEDRLPSIQAEDQLKAEDIKQEILFPIRQKRMDLLQHLAVSMQGYMALQVIKQNNTELIRGVDRASKTTVAALRTAIIVSEALGTQKLVLNQINEVNNVTNRLIESNSELLKTQGVEIQKQATESTVNTQVLEKAFQNIFQAMDAIDSYRAQALPQMEKTVTALEKSVENAKNYLSSRRENRIGDFAKELTDDEGTKNDNKGVVKIRP
jgi:uncharacterized protein YaaN involved in tellurite resistance